MTTHRDVFHRVARIAVELDLEFPLYVGCSSLALQEAEDAFMEWKWDKGIVFPLGFAEIITILQVAEGSTHLTFLAVGLKELRNTGILNALLSLDLIFWELDVNTTVVASMLRKDSQKRSRFLRKAALKAKEERIDPLLVEYVKGHLSGYPLFKLDLSIQRHKGFAANYNNEVSRLLQSVALLYKRYKFRALAREIKNHQKIRHLLGKVNHVRRSKISCDEKESTEGVVSQSLHSRRGESKDRGGVSP